jgi:hypothetical protein
LKHHSIWHAHGAVRLTHPEKNHSKRSHRKATLKVTPSTRSCLRAFSSPFLVCSDLIKVPAASRSRSVLSHSSTSDSAQPALLLALPTHPQTIVRHHKHKHIFRTDRQHSCKEVTKPPNHPTDAACHEGNRVEQVMTLCSSRGCRPERGQTKDVAF